MLVGPSWMIHHINYKDIESKNKDHSFVGHGVLSAYNVYLLWMYFNRVG